MASAPNTMQTIRKKFVIVGDGSCGKTCLLQVFKTGTFPAGYVPTIFENYIADIVFRQQTVELALWDTAGQEDFDRLRPLSYPGTDAVLVCYSVGDPTSLENIVEKWLPEVRHFCPKAPIVLVGCKSDIRKDKAVLAKLAAEGLAPVPTQEGEATALKMEAAAFVECSSLTNTNVEEVFIAATEAAIKSGQRAKRSKWCCIG